MRIRSPFRPISRNYRVEDSASEATMYIYDEIGYWGVTANKFVKDLNSLKEKTINIRINSPGGSVFDGLTIFNAIRDHKSTVNIHIDGLAASISSIIALSGDRVFMAKNAFFMVHNPWSIAIGSAEDMRKEADLLDKVSGSLVQAYVDKTGKSNDEIDAMMDAETWLTADESLENGFIDEITGQQEAAAGLFDLSVYNNAPETLKTEKQEPTKRELERVLRDAGCSQKQAKAMLSGHEKSRDEVWAVEATGINNFSKFIGDIKK